MVNAAQFFKDAETRGSLTYMVMSDEEIVAKAQRGDREACEFLLYKYRNLVRSKVKSYFLAGAERDDLLQVGMIGLWEAVMDYRSDKTTSFACFAKVCVQRQMISAIKAATRQKQTPLNTSISLEATRPGDNSGRTLPEMLACHRNIDPEDIVMGSEGRRLLKQSLQRELSLFEWRVLTAYQTGKSYKEMADDLHCKVKSIDNALSRIRRKLPQIAMTAENMGAGR